jgi:hypothetical protein
MNRISSMFAVLGLLVLPLAGAAQLPTLDPRVEALVAEVSEERLRYTVDRLAGFQTRSTLSDTVAEDRGIGAARRWILLEMRSYSPRLQVDFDIHGIEPGGRIPHRVVLSNVMAVLPGRSERRIYVSGHYDTTARPEPVEGSGALIPAPTFDNPAPGANDDGSGTALTMELARVFAQSGIEFDATPVFIALAGEEQGLIGARVHAQEAARNGIRIDAVFNNDIVGNVRGGNGAVDGTSVRVFSEGPEDSPSRQMAHYIRRMGERYVPEHRVVLIAREDRFGRGGDHTAFNQLGFAAVRFTEPRENYERQHTVHDTPDGVDEAYLARNTRVNAAAVASLALAPGAPVVTTPNGQPRLTRQPSGYDANLSWSPVPGAAAYRIVWREAWGPDWTHELLVGNVTNHVFRDLSIDDRIFGVAAVGPGGEESLITPYVRPPRESQDIPTWEVGRD